MSKKYKNEVYATMKYRLNLKTLMGNIFFIVCVLALCWAVLSWLEVITFNLGTAHVYCKYNLFQIMINGGIK